MPFKMQMISGFMESCLFSGYFSKGVKQKESVFKIQVNVVPS